MSKTKDDYDEELFIKKADIYFYQLDQVKVQIDNGPEFAEWICWSEMMSLNTKDRI